jgi:hypothetical protein
MRSLVILFVLLAPGCGSTGPTEPSLELQLTGIYDAYSINGAPLPYTVGTTGRTTVSERLSILGTFATLRDSTMVVTNGAPFNVSGSCLYDVTHLTATGFTLIPRSGCGNVETVVWAGDELSVGAAPVRFRRTP